jgi:hypothetical protein
MILNYRKALRGRSLSARAESSQMASWSDVRRIALALPGTSEKSSSGGTLVWTVNNKTFVWERPLRRADLAALGASAPTGPILGVHTADLELKDVLLMSDRDIFFTTPHFDGYPAVLMRLQKIRLKQLEDVLCEAWLGRAPKRVVAAYLRSREEAPRRPRRGTRASA